MTRLAFALFVFVFSTGIGVASGAQAPEDASTEPTSPPPAGTEETPLDLSAPAAKAGTGDRRVLWEDIVVVPRKAFLKSGRLELAPFTGISLNDVLIRHYSFGADLSFFLTDVFSVGLQGQYFVKERSTRESLVGLQYNRISTLNRYLYAGALNFGYVPGYGKFTLFNRYIWHWDIFVNAGVGLIWTEIIPRDPANEKFQTMNIMPDFAVGTRFFLNRWLTVSFAFRDYVFNDRFEPLTRDRTWNIERVKSEAHRQFVNNIMFTASVGFFLPTSFEYRTPR